MVRYYLVVVMARGGEVVVVVDVGSIQEPELGSSLHSRGYLGGENMI